MVTRWGKGTEGQRDSLVCSPLCPHQEGGTAATLSPLIPGSFQSEGTKQIIISCQTLSWAGSREVWAHLCALMSHRYPVCCDFIFGQGDYSWRPSPYPRNPKPGSYPGFFPWMWLNLQSWWHIRGAQHLLPRALLCAGDTSGLSSLITLLTGSALLVPLQPQGQKPLGKGNIWKNKVKAG